MKNKNEENKETKRKKKNSLPEIAGIIVLGFAIIFIFSNVVSYLYHNYRYLQYSSYYVCREQLYNVKTGLESYLAEKKTLKGANVPESMCNHIIPGYEKATGCEGKVQERLNNVCENNSFSFDTTNGTDFELKAISNEKKHCRICVTEKGSALKRYRDCDSKFVCEH